MKAIYKLLISATVAFMLTKILRGVHIDHFFTAIVFALVMSVLNSIVAPIFRVIGFPVTLLTLGFFSLVINAMMVLLADYFVEGMEVDGFWWAFFFSIALSFITYLLDEVFINKD